MREFTGVERLIDSTEVYLAALYEAETQGIADDYIVVLQPGTNGIAIYAHSYTVNIACDILFQLPII